METQRRMSASERPDNKVTERRLFPTSGRLRLVNGCHLAPLATLHCDKTKNIPNIRKISSSVSDAMMFPVKKKMMTGMSQSCARRVVPIQKFKI
jgi:hypothetical protein